MYEKAKNPTDYYAKDIYNAPNVLATFAYWKAEKYRELIYNQLVRLIRQSLDAGVSVRLNKIGTIKVINGTNQRVSITDLLGQMIADDGRQMTRDVLRYFSMAILQEWRTLLFRGDRLHLLKVGTIYVQLKEPNQYGVSFLRAVHPSMILKNNQAWIEQNTASGQWEDIPNDYDRPWLGTHQEKALIDYSNKRKLKIKKSRTLVKKITFIQSASVFGRAKSDGAYLQTFTPDTSQDDPLAIDYALSKVEHFYQR
jgi:hypothetical protein